MVLSPFLLGVGLLDQFHNRLESLRIGHGHVGQNLAVQLDVGLQQAGDELAVAQAERTDGGVDADDPQPAEIALAVVAVAVGVDAGADEIFLGGTQQAATAADVSASPS